MTNVNAVGSRPTAATPDSLARSVEQEFAQAVRAHGLTPSSVRELGKLAKEAVEKGMPPAEAERAIQQAVQAVGGSAGKSTLAKLLSEMGGGAYLFPGLDLLVAACGFKDLFTVPSAGGAREAAAERSIGLQSRLRAALSGSGGAAALRQVLESPGGAGALAALARSALRPGFEHARQALLRGLPAVGQLAAQGNGEARRVLQWLTEAHDPALRQGACIGVKAPAATPTATVSPGLIQQVRAQGSVDAATALRPGLERIGRARDTAYAELGQLVRTTGSQTELVDRANDVAKKVQHLDERVDRYTALVGGQRVLSQLPVPGLRDTDGTTLDLARIGQKIAQVSQQLTSAASDVNKAISLLSEGIRGQQNKYAAQVFDQQSKGVAQSLAAMDADIADARHLLFSNPTSPANARDALAQMQTARAEYASHARKWLSNEYSRSLIDAGNTGEIRDSNGQALDRKKLSAGAAVGVANLEADVSAFDAAERQFGKTKLAPRIQQPAGDKTPPKSSNETPGNPDPTSPQQPKGNGEPKPVPIDPRVPRPDPNVLCSAELPGDGPQTPSAGHDGHDDRRTPAQRRLEELGIGAILAGNVAFSQIGVRLAQAWAVSTSDPGKQASTPTVGEAEPSQELQAQLLTGVSFESKDGLQLVVSDPVADAKGQESVFTDAFFNAGWTHGHDSQLLLDLKLPADSPLQRLAGSYFNVATSTSIDVNTKKTSASIMTGTLSPRVDLPDMTTSSGRTATTGLYSTQYLQFTIKGGDPAQVAQAQAQITAEMTPLRQAADQKLTALQTSELKEWTVMKQRLGDTPAFETAALALHETKYAPKQVAIASELRQTEVETIKRFTATQPFLRVETKSSNGAALLWQNPNDMLFDPKTGNRTHSDGRQIRKDGYFADPSGCLTFDQTGADPKDWAFTYASVAFSTPVGTGSGARAAVGAYPLTEAHGRPGQAAGLAVLATVDGVVMTTRMTQAITGGQRLLSDGAGLYLETGHATGKFTVVQAPGAPAVSLADLEKRGAEPVKMDIAGEMFAFGRGTGRVTQYRQDNQLYAGTTVGVAFEASLTADGTKGVEVKTPVGNFRTPFKGLDSLRTQIQQFVTAASKKKASRATNSADRAAGGSSFRQDSPSGAAGANVDRTGPARPVPIVPAQPYGPVDLQQRI